MKKIFAMLFLASIFVACTKNDDTTSSNGNFTANINGVGWSANKYGAARSAGLTNVTGSSSNKMYITMTLSGQSVGVYRLTYNTANALVLMDSSTSTPINYTSNASTDTSLAGGYVYITTVDTANKTVSGTFWSKVYNQSTNSSKPITNGVFTNIPYATTGSTSGSDTLTLTLNGNYWAPPSKYTSNQSGYISIGGFEGANGKSISVALPTTVTAGAYTLASFGTTYLVNYNAATTDPYLTTSGTITVLEHNTSTKRVRGTFAMNASNANFTATATVTNGYFSFSYP